MTQTKRNYPPPLSRICNSAMFRVALQPRRVRQNQMPLNRVGMKNNFIKSVFGAIREQVNQRISLIRTP